MQVFLIDPKACTITSIDTPTDFETLYKVMDCDMVRPLHGAFVGTHDVLYLDEDALPKGVPDAFVTPHGACFGKAVVLSVVRGKEASPTISLEELKAQVRFPALMQGEAK